MLNGLRESSILPRDHFRRRSDCTFYDLLVLSSPEYVGLPNMWMVLDLRKSGGHECEYGFVGCNFISPVSANKFYVF